MPAVPPSANPTSAVPNEPAKPAVSKEPLKPPVADERPKSAVPDEQDTEEKTLDEAPQANAIGPVTNEVSAPTACMFFCTSSPYDSDFRVQRGGPRQKRHGIS